MKQNIIRLFKVLDQWKWQYLLSASLLLIAIFFRTLEPKLIQIVVDQVIAFYAGVKNELMLPNDAIAKSLWSIVPDPRTHTGSFLFIALALIYIAIVLIRSTLLFSSSAIKAFYTEKAIKQFRDRLFGHIQLLPLAFFTSTSTGEIIQRSTGDIDTIKNFIMDQVIELVRLLAIFGFSFMMMAMVDLKYAIICIIMVPAIGVTSYFFFKKEGKVWEEHEDEADKLNAISKENLNGIRVVKSFSNEELEKERFDKQNKRKLAIGLKHNGLHVKFWSMSDGLFWVQIVISLIYGGLITIKGQLTIGELLSFYTYVMMVAWPMRQVGRILSQMGMAAVAMGRISKILDTPIEEYQGESLPNKLDGEIEFENVSFKYPASDKYVLDNVSFKIKAGDHVALLGPTAAGKSTVVQLILGFYKVDKGAIKVDGMNVNDLSKEDLRSRIGLVLQKPFLFSTTVKNNVAYSLKDVDHSMVEEITEIAQFKNLDHILSAGYDTPLGEKGINLSGGQKQRLSIARTLISDPDILILDDVTSALDTETEHRFFEQVKPLIKNKTCLTITHRMASIAHVDRIITIMDGKVSEQGKPEDLIEEDGYFRSIHRLQSGWFEDLFHNNKIN